jgi:hypothetical protein
MTETAALRALAVLLAVLIGSAARADAQQPAARSDSSSAQIHVGLRAFYFNLAHRDWDALTADILPAKIVAHRPAPDALVSATASGGTVGLSATTDDPAACSSRSAVRVDQATITLDGDWAEVSVPRCTALAGADEFRLIHFENRWRFVYIHLFEEPVSVSTDR